MCAVPTSDSCAAAATFLSCDWGGTSFRLRLVQRRDASILGAVQVGRGAAAVATDGRADPFAEALRNALDELDARVPGAAHAGPVVLSGMVTSAYGWRELPYAEAPCTLDGTGFVTATGSLDWHGGDIPLCFVSGVRADDDVMRGEECELAGLLRHPDWARFAPDGEAVAILPGTHSKHAHLAHGRLTGFRTFMTGELFDVLGRHSVLRHSVAGADAALDEPGLAAGVAAVCAHGLAATLFRARTARLLHGASPGWCRAFLSGALIGAELAALRLAAPTARLVLCATGLQAPAYRVALEILGLAVQTACLPPEEVATLSVRGHAAIFEGWAARRCR